MAEKGGDGGAQHFLKWSRRQGAVGAGRGRGLRLGGSVWRREKAAGGGQGVAGDKGDGDVRCGTGEGEGG
jgi:hypothetical protein